MGERGWGNETDARTRGLRRVSRLLGDVGMQSAGAYQQEGAGGA